MKTLDISVIKAYALWYSYSDKINKRQLLKPHISPSIPTEIQSAFNFEQFNEWLEKTHSCKMLAGTFNRQYIDIAYPWHALNPYGNPEGFKLQFKNEEDLVWYLLKE